MRRYRQFLIVLASVVTAALVAVAAAVAVAGASASHQHAASTTLRFSGKTTAVIFTNPSGKTVGNPKPGDRLFDSLDLYPGTSKHHASRWTGSGFSDCKIKQLVSQSDVRASCESVLALGGSMVTSFSTQNIAAQTNVYPIDHGTGKWAMVKGGSVRTTSADGGNKIDVVVTIKP